MSDGSRAALPAAVAVPAAVDVPAVADAVAAAAALAGAVARNGVSALRVAFGAIEIEIDAAPAAGTEAPDAGTGPDVPELVTVAAPTIGVLRLRPRPDAPAFVEVGDPVEAGQQVAVVEIMRRRDPVLVDRPGRVLRFDAAEGQIVEYGQPLLVVRTGGAA